MAINIFKDVTPNVVSRNLNGYSMLIYGDAKAGKTTFATRADKHLLLGFEKGYNALPGVMAAPINSWAEFLQVLNQLKTDKKRRDLAAAKGEHLEAQFETIIIDIVDIAYDYCEKYICSREGVETIGDIGFGKGYNLVAQEFDSKLRSIIQMDYGLILISHAGFVTDPDDETIKTASPTLAKRPKNIVTRLVDIYGYVTMDVTEEGTVHTMHLRRTPSWEAGARFKYIADSIELDYKNLVEAVHDAIDKEAEELGIAPVEETVNHYTAVDTPDFDEVISRVKELTQSIMGNSEDKDKSAKSIANIIENGLGKDRKLSDATEDNVEQLIVIEMELKGLLK